MPNIKGQPIIGTGVFSGCRFEENNGGRSKCDLYSECKGQMVKECRKESKAKSKWYHGNWKRIQPAQEMKCPHCGSTLMWSEDRGANCDGCDEFNPETDIQPASETPTLPEDVRIFIQRVTLHLQASRSKTPEQNDAMFQDAYRLYSKYDVEGRGKPIKEVVG